MTFKKVQVGIAIISPKIPNKKPEKIITKKISNGCDFTDDENIIGCSNILSISCIIVKPKIRQIESFIKSLTTNNSKLVVKDNTSIKNMLIIGPKYGIIFRMAHINAIASKLFTPTTNNNTEQKIKSVKI